MIIDLINNLCKMIEGSRHLIMIYNFVIADMPVLKDLEPKKLL